MVTKTTVSDINLSVTPTYINVLKIIPEKSTSNVIDFINTDQFIEGFTEISNVATGTTTFDLAINPIDDNLYYTDITANVVNVVTQADPGVVLFSIGEGILSAPRRLAVDRRNNAVVYDNTLEKIFIISEDNTVLSEFFSPGISDIVINENDDIICTNSTLDKVLIFDKFLHLKRQFGTSGTGIGEFQFPSAVRVDALNQSGTQNIIVVSTVRGVVSVFTSNGNFLFEFGSVGSGSGEFTSPSTLAVLSNRDIVVGDLNSRFQVFDSSSFVICSDMLLLKV